jgi:hypothetical protein
MNPNRNRVQGEPSLPADVLGHRKARTSALSALPETVLSGDNARETRPSSISSEGEPCIAKSSSCGDCEGPVLVEETACPSPFYCGGCSDVLHELSNVMTGVLTNAQVLSWKLPPYSHLKRAVRELERGAQRSAALMKRLRERCPDRP